ncbi:MAG: pyrroline-5-carboxylate reductase [Pseudomonadota bacterium]
MNILIVGGGFMGGAFRGCWAEHAITTIDPVQTCCVKSIDDLPAGYVPDVIMLAVKPQVMEQVLPPYIAAFASANCIWVSVAAGLPVAFYKKFDPGLRFVRCMPNMPVVYQAGAIGLFSDCKDDVAPVVDALFAKAGLAVWVDDESLMNAVTAVSGSGPAYFYLMVEALTNAGVEQGLNPEHAAALSRQTLIGAGEMLKGAADTDAATLRKQVTSPGGTTAAALAVMMEDDQFERVIKDAAKAAYDRGMELGA